MTTDELKETLSHTPFLIIDVEKNTATLAAEAETLRAIGGPTLILNAQRSLARIAAMTKGRERFSITDLAAAAGVNYHTAHLWVRDEIIPPSIRERAGSGRGLNPIFSFGDLFTAGIVGALRRHDFGLQHLKLVAPLFADKKRTTDAAATAR